MCVYRRGRKAAVHRVHCTVNSKQNACGCWWWWRHLWAFLVSVSRFEYTKLTLFVLLKVVGPRDTANATHSLLTWVQWITSYVNILLSTSPPLILSFRLCKLPCCHKFFPPIGTPSFLEQASPVNIVISCTTGTQICSGTDPFICPLTNSGFIIWDFPISQIFVFSLDKTKEVTLGLVMRSFNPNVLHWDEARSLPEMGAWMNHFSKLYPQFFAPVFTMSLWSNWNLAAKASELYW